MLNRALPPLEEITYTMPQIWDSTMIVAARKCPTLLLYAYINHVRGGEGVNPALHFGGTFAHGMEAYRQTYWATKDKGTAFFVAAEAMINFWGDNPSVLIYRGKPDKRTLDKCIYALAQYFENWPIDTDRLQPHINSNGTPTFEYSFSVPLDEPIFPRMDDGSPFILCGRADTLGAYDDLPVWSDEKTTIVMGDSWAEQWYTRHQFLTYGWAFRKLGFKARHVLVRGVGIYVDYVAFRETTPIERPDHLLDKFQYELAWTLHEMKGYLHGRKVPARLGDACYSHFRQCQFWDVCSTKPAYELPFLRTMGRNEWNPLMLAGIGEGE